MTSDRRLKPLRLGLGLIEGYNKIKEEMSKPHLRAGLERDLQAVCDGAKTSAEVLLTQIEMYRSVFQQVSQNAAILGQEIRRTNLAYNDNDDDDGGDAPGGQGPGGPGGRGGGTGGSGYGGGGGGNDPPGPQPPRRNIGTTAGSSSAPNRAQSNATSATTSAGSTSTAPPVCDCGLPAKKNTTKNGKNAGRKFYGCPDYKGPGTGCKFFKWHEASDQPGAQSGGSGAGTSSGRGTGSRKCGNCGKTGHLRSKCPEPEKGGTRRGRGRGRGAPAAAAADYSFSQAYDDFYD